MILYFLQKFDAHKNVTLAVVWCFSAACYSEPIHNEHIYHTYCPGLEKGIFKTWSPIFSFLSNL